MPDMDLYGKKLQIEMLTRIRDEKNFDSAEDLREALKLDKAFSERFIKDNYA
jgi:riboflavin kinase/FMN adenylyltransferase